MWISFSIYFCILFISVNSMCSTKQLNISKLYDSIELCRKQTTTPTPIPEPHRVLPTTTSARRINNVRRTIIIQKPSINLRPPFLIRRINTKDIFINPDLVKKVIRSPRSFILPRTSSLQSPTFKNNFANVHTLLNDDNEALDAWEFGAHDKKCVFNCAFHNLGMVDDDGIVITTKIKSFFEHAAETTDLKNKSLEIVDLCIYKMIHVSTIEENHEECDYPLMITRCILGRLSKHCDEENKTENKVIHPDVEILE